MTFSFHPAASDELNQGVDYYEECKPGLGYDFLEEVYATIARTMPLEEKARKLKKVRPNLKAAYAEMAKDRKREKEAAEWVHVGVLSHDDLLKSERGK